MVVTIHEFGLADQCLLGYLRNPDRRQPQLGPPLLWMRAGSEGRRIEETPEKGWDIADTYGLLTDLDQAAEFCDALKAKCGIRIAYVVKV